MPYEPAEYWSRLIVGDGDLAHVGHPSLGRYNRFAYRFRLRALQRALGGLGVRGKSVFEAAFGEGFYLGFWAAAGAVRVAGLDIAPAAVAAARARYPSYQLEAGDLRSPEDLARFSSFDLVTALDVLYHIVDDRDFAVAVATLAAKVVPGGSLLLTDKFPAREPFQRFPHVRRRPLAVYEALLRPKGFVLARTVPVFCLMDEPITVGAHPWLGVLATQQWRVAAKALRLAERYPSLQASLAAAIATLQAGPERVLVRTLGRVPNTEIAVFTRTGGES